MIWKEQKAVDQRAAGKRLEEMCRLEGPRNEMRGPSGSSISPSLPETSGHGVGPSSWRTRPCGQLEEIRRGQNILILVSRGSGPGPAGEEQDDQPHPGGPRLTIGESLPQPHGGCSLSEGLGPIGDEQLRGWNGNWYRS